MKYEKVVDMDLNNGDGIGVTLWVTGCPHHCYGCHNKIYGMKIEVRKII